MDGNGYNSSWRRTGRPRESASLSNLNHPTPRDTARSSYPSSNYGNSASTASRDLYNPSTCYSTTTPRDSSSYSSPYSTSNYPTSSSSNHHYKPSSHSGYSTPIKSSPPVLSSPLLQTNGVSSSGLAGTTYTTIPIHSNGTNGLHTSSGLTGRGLSSLTTPECKSNLGELKSSLSEMKNLQTNSSLAAASQVTTQSQSVSESRNSTFNRSSLASANHTSNEASLKQLQGGFKRQETTSPSIMEMPSTGEVNIDECSDSLGMPIVTSPLSEMPDMDLNFGSDSGENSGLTSPNLVSSMNSGGLTLSNASPLAKMSNLSAMTTANSYSHEERKTSKTSSKKIVTANNSSSEHRSESATASAAQMTRVQAGDVSLQEKSSAFASKSRLEKDGVVAEKESGLKHQSRTQRVNDTVQQESQTATMNANRLQAGGFCAENASAAVASSKSSLDSSGKFTSESHASTASSKKMSLTSGGVTRSSQLLNTSQYSKMINTKMNKEELNKYLMSFEDLDNLGNTTNLRDVENTLVKYCGVMSNTVDQIKAEKNEDSIASWITKVNNMMTKAWTVPRFGQDIGETLCEIMRNNGGMDLVMDNLTASHSGLQFNSAKLLHQCLVTENKNYVVEKGLDKAVAVAKKYTSDRRDVDQTRVGTGILENLFNHSEAACGDVIAMGGLDTVVDECQSTDIETLRHCASALANAAMYGGSENQELMIKRHVPHWLFPLIVHPDESIKYYACLAITVLGANKEIEAVVQKSGSLDRVMPFLSQKNPADFAEMSAKQSHGQSSAWLRRLLPVLTSNREEAKNLAAFHFCMEAEIKVKQGKTSLFEEIGAIEALKKVASSPNGIASKYAAQALRIIGEDVPHKLSQQVPTWSVEDVKEWVKQIGFANFSEAFVDSRVDGDLLLQLSEDMLREDIQMKNGILRRRFLRELSSLRKRTDYSSVDSSGLNDFLQSLGPEYSVYTYEMLNSGIDKDTLLTFSDEQLLIDCGITNKIHRLKIQHGVKMTREDFSYSEESLEKNLDVFISYRRSNGSQLASLLKVHLELRDYTVFLDVVGLEAGKFDNNLLQSIRSSKNFILVCTAGAMDRCVSDNDQKDWIHKEIACALNSQCNIIPVFDNFVMPDPESLPESMRPITSYNGVRWIHDYQEACIDKIKRFISGEVTGGPMMDRFLASSNTGSQYSYGRQNTYQRTISQDSNANSTRSDDTFTNGPKEQ
eukprot:GFUD01003864.1.p1 GENE.GFUD01003864.1~~GFUD01003864.1.p1  ORF type:complete len:1212 (+),score=220.77 GFUD01003864.1:159-3794(+)